ncbi:MAG TPA: YdcH family protein [Burkholderiales bacterium]
MIETGDQQTQVQMKQRLHDLQVEHRDLDAAIHRLAEDPSHDQLALTRMKRRKLLLKDQIAWIERQLDPDIRA